MFSQYTYKQKFYALVAIMLLLGITAYKRSFSLTLNTYAKHKELSEQLVVANAAMADGARLNQEIKALDKLIGKADMEPQLVQQELLNFVSQSDDKRVKVEEVKQIHQVEDRDFWVYTNQLVLSGTFESLLKVVYRFEKEFEFSRVVSVQFNKKKNYRTKREKLFVNIVFQNYEKINE